MTRLLLAVALGVVLIDLAQSEGKVAAKAERTAPMIGHMVYFKLKDGSPEARKKFVASCDKYLSAHDGTVFYSAGTLSDAFKGEANDREWDVALHVVFADKAAHDKYQIHPDHKKFVSENKAAMEKVRVFDSELGGAKVGKPTAPVGSP